MDEDGETKDKLVHGRRMRGILVPPQAGNRAPVGETRHNGAVQLTGRPQRRNSRARAADSFHQVVVAVVVVVVALMAGPAAAGAWVKPPGGGYAKVGSASFISDVAYDDDGVRVDSDPFILKAQTIYGYAELGIGPRLMLVGYLPWVASTNQLTGDDGSLAFHTIGFGDAQLGLQFGILQDGPFVVAARADAKVPLYQGAPSVQGRNADGVDGFSKSAGRFPALGDGQVDVTTSMLIGGSFPFDGFFTWETGYRLRTGDVSDAFVGGGTFGVFFLDRRLLPMWNLSFIYSLDARTRDDGQPLEVLGKGYVSTGPACMIQLDELKKGLALEVGAELVFRGKNAAGGVNLQSGLSYAF